MGTALERPDPLEQQGLDVFNKLVEGMEISSGPPRLHRLENGGPRQ